MITTISQKEDFEMFFPEQSNNFYKLLFDGLVRSKQIYGENGVMMINNAELASNGFKGFIGTVGNSEDNNISIDNMIMLHTKPINNKHMTLKSSSNSFILKDEKNIKISSDYMIIDKNNIDISLPLFKLDNSIEVPYSNEIRVGISGKSITVDKSNKDTLNIPAICRNGYYNKSYPYISLDSIDFEENDAVYIDITVLDIDNINDVPDYELIKTPNGVYVKWLVSSINDGDSLTFERGEYSETLGFYEFCTELILNHNIIPTSRGEQNADHVDDQLRLSL